MVIKELLLNGKAFLSLLKDFSIDAKNIFVKDEEAILFEVEKAKTDILKETVCIEGNNEYGRFNFFGVLHFNLLTKLAVFELQEFEQLPPAVS